eukprot:GFYU01047070.1.p1 GENE.GFYU01047070.1~~GFYU01047070.1.p1  ORF type:complete len:102 (+),score=25.99 GFYU01047070.1:173-478(+)
MGGACGSRASVDTHPHGAAAASNRKPVTESRTTVVASEGRKGSATDHGLTQPVRAGGGVAFHDVQLAVQQIVEDVVLIQAHQQRRVISTVEALTLNAFGGS